MVLFSAVALGLIIGILSRGSFSGFAVGAARFRWLPLMIAAALVQVVIFTPPVGSREIVHNIGPYVYIATILATLVFLSANRHIPGLTVILAGTLLNATVIIANGGFMPSPESALREVGIYEEVRTIQESPDGGGLTHTNTVIAADDAGLFFDSGTPLLVLGDVIAIPDGIPAANVISIGDILIAIGAAIAVVRVMHMRPQSESRPAAQELSS